MDKQHLLDLLELDDLNEFSYFENYSSLLESEEAIDFDLFYEVLEEVPNHTLSELTDTYFEDIMQGIPDDDMDLYTLFQNIRHTLVVLASASDTARNRVLYIEELFKFRNWFLLEELVTCTKSEPRVERRIPVSEAMTLYRLEKLSLEQYEYDFSDALDYDLDEYAISVVEDLESCSKEYEEEQETDQRESLDELEEDPFAEGLIDRHFPVMDDETEEDLL